MAETVYLKTSIFEYLTARPSQSLILDSNYRYCLRPMNF